MKAKLCMLLTLFVSITFGQNTIKGTLLSPEQKPVEGANVLLLSLPDSTLVKGAISGKDGTFELPIPQTPHPRPLFLKVPIYPIVISTYPIPQAT